MKTKNAEYVAQHRQRRKHREALVETLKAEGGVQWTLDAVDYQADAINPLGDGLKITWLLTEGAREALIECAANERGQTFDTILTEMDGKLMAYLLQLGVIQHDYRLKEETDGS